MTYPNPNDLYLCIDQGGHASRVLVFNQHGEMICQAFQPITARHTQADYIEYDAKAVVDSIRSALHSVFTELGPKQQAIKAAGLATQRSNVVCWDSQTGQALSPIISWQDRRGVSQVRSLQPHAEQIRLTTGLFLSSHYGASKLRWCLDHLPDVQAALATERLRYGPMASYLIHQLVEEQPHLTDSVNASRTQLLNLQTLDWDPTLLALFNVPREPLPVCVPNLHSYGHLREAPAIPLLLVNGDQASAMYAYGALQPETAYLNIGTGAFLARPSGQARVYGRRLLTSLIWHQPDDTEFVLEGTVNGAGAALEWFEKEYTVPNLLQDLPHWLEEVYEEPALFLNGIAGLGAPFLLADFPSRFEGATRLEARAVAVVDSIVFLIQSGLEEMLKLASPPQQIQISGGLAHLGGLCQRIADLSGLPLYRPRQIEATGRGTAYLLAGLPSHWPEEKPGDWFMPKNNPSLLQTYRTWSALMRQNMRTHPAS